MGKIKICAACGNRDISKSYHLVPKEKNRRELWLKNIGIDSHINLPNDLRICALHFKDDCFIKSGEAIVCNRRRLKKTAVPSIVIDTRKSESSHENSHNNNQKKKNQTAYCLMCGWSTENCSLFRFPRDINSRNEWIKNLGIENMSPLPTNDKRLCSIHFSKADIILLPTSKKPYLRKGSVPIKSKTTENLYKIDTNRMPSDFTIKVESDTIDTVQEVTKNYSVPSTSMTSVIKCELDCQEDNSSSMVDENVSLETVTVTPMTNGRPGADEVFMFQASSPIPDSLYSVLLVNPTTTHRNESESTRHKIRKLRYIGNIRSSHLTPRRAKNCIEMTKAVIIKQRKVIKSLERKLRLARTEVRSLKDLIQDLNSQLYLSEDASNYVMVEFS